MKDLPKAFWIFYYKKVKNPRSHKELIKQLYLYALSVIKGPFPLAESILARDYEYAYLYSNNVLKAPFPLGEPFIAKNPGRAYLYSRDVLKSPFLLGESAIRKDNVLWEDYIELFSERSL